jgi:hypothetical protein
MARVEIAERHCRNCQHYRIRGRTISGTWHQLTDDDGNPAGICQAHPPTHQENSIGWHTLGKWPMVRGNDCCGEHCFQEGKQYKAVLRNYRRNQEYQDLLIARLRRANKKERATIREIAPAVGLIQRAPSSAILKRIARRLTQNGENDDKQGQAENADKMGN